MKRSLFIAAVVFFLNLSPFSSLNAWSRLGQSADIVFINTGTKATGISVSVNTTSPTLVYSADNNDREILLQNTSSTFAVWIGTSTSFTATTGPRMKLRPSQDVTTDCTTNLYVIVDTGGSTTEMTGWVEFDPKDLR